MKAVFGVLLTVVGLIVLVGVTPFGLAAYLDMRGQCPNGGNCDDAKDLIAIALGRKLINAE